MIKNIMSKFVAILFMLSSMSYATEVMYWEVDSGACIDGIPIRDYLDAYQANIQEWDDWNDWFAVRVEVSDSSWTDSIFLDIYGVDEYGNPELWDGEFGVELSENGDGRWGTGHYGTQSPINLEVTESSIFTAQIGYAHYDEATDESYWTTLADSVPVEYENLIGVHTYTQGSIAPPGYTPWNPTSFTTDAPSIPEPSTGILIALGVCVFIARRNHKD